MAKLRQKISGGMRTRTGNEHFGALRSYIATTAKHDLGAFPALSILTAGNPWLLKLRDQLPHLSVSTTCLRAARRPSSAIRSYR